MDVNHQPRPTAAFSMMGVQVAPLVRGGDAAGAWEAVHQTVAPDGGSPLHTIGSDKLFVVLAGEVVLVVDGVEHRSGPGASATVPAGVPHCFRNRSDAPAELLVVTSDTGHVAFLEGLAGLSTGGRPDPDALAAHAAAHHVQFV